MVTKKRKPLSGKKKPILIQTPVFQTPAPAVPSGLGLTEIAFLVVLALAVFEFANPPLVDWLPAHLSSLFQ